MQRQDVAAVGDLLQASTDVNARQVDGMTALHWAAYYDDTALVGRLVEAGADVHAANRYGVTPLSLAAENANAEMVERLLGAGADPNTTLPGGETVLMTAARTGRVGAVRALLAAGANLVAQEPVRGQTALMWAVAEGHADVVETLVEVGADFRTPLASGFTPFLFAVREGHLGVVQTLARRGCGCQPHGRRGDPPGAGVPHRRAAPGRDHAADGGGHQRPLGRRRGAARRGRRSERRRPRLYRAAPGSAGAQAGGRRQRPGAVRFGSDVESRSRPQARRARRADLNARMSERRNLNVTRHHEVGSTPFMLAALVADAELMRMLTELGADPLAKNDEFSTPLMAAAGLGTRSPGEDAGTEEEVLETVKLLLELGDDINAVDDNGETAMHGAAYKNLPRVVEFLAANGANDRRLERGEPLRLDAADDRPGLPLRELQAVTGDRRRPRKGDGRGWRRTVERGGCRGRRHLRAADTSRAAAASRCRAAALISRHFRRTSEASLGSVKVPGGNSTSRFGNAQSACAPVGPLRMRQVWRSMGRGSENARRRGQPDWRGGADRGRIRTVSARVGHSLLRSANSWHGS